MTTEEQIEKYEYYTDKICDGLKFNHNGTECEEIYIGQDGVYKILEHHSMGEGDKHYFDVVYDNGRVTRIFNPHQAYYNIKQKP